MEQKIAITGGRGRLARVMAAYLRQQGAEVTLFSRRAGEGMHALSTLLDPEVIVTFTTLIHNAWSTVPFTSEKNPGQEMREDLPLLEKMLEMFSQVPQKDFLPKFLFLSSASVYGNQEGMPAIESTPCHPLSEYARAKLLAEKMLLKASFQEPRLKCVILRITNLLGLPSDSIIPQGILGKILEAATQNSVLELWGDGNASKDYLWIDDFLEAITIAVEQPLQGIFNVGANKNFSLLEFIKIVEEVTQRSLKIKHYPEYSWDVKHAAISSVAFSQLTGWSPHSDISQKIRGLFL